MHDTSERGLGAALLQKVERDLLAVVFALGKFEQYMYGRSVMIEGDHQPLEAIAKKPLRYAAKRRQGIHISQDPTRSLTPTLPTTQVHRCTSLTL